MTYGVEVESPSASGSKTHSSRVPRQTTATPAQVLDFVYEAYHGGSPSLRGQRRAFRRDYRLTSLSHTNHAFRAVRAMARSSSESSPPPTRHSHILPLCWCSLGCLAPRPCVALDLAWDPGSCL